MLGTGEDDRSDLSDFGSDSGNPVPFRGFIVAVTVAVAMAVALAATVAVAVAVTGSLQDIAVIL